MDTKWNNTEQQALPGEVLREAKPKHRRPPGRFRAFISFLSFFLGVTLVLASLGSMGAQLAWERDLHPRFPDSWQETGEFRQEVCGAVKDFLTVGAGGRLDFYSGDYWLEEGDDILYACAEPESVYENVFLWDWGNEATTIEEALPDRADLGIAPAFPVEPDDDSSDKPDTFKPLGTRYESDKNLLYFISCKDGKTYDNCGGDLQKLKSQTLEGFNFYLTFEKGKAAIVWDGQPVDIYGDGVYHTDSQWFLPGYENFPATEQLDGVSVQLAVRQTPSSYYAVDYQTGQSYSSSPMYYLFQRVQGVREFYQIQAAVLASGVLCLFVWFCLRKYRGLADRKIASWTLHVWTEARFFAVLFCVVPVFFSGERLPDVWWTIRYEVIDGRMFSSFASSVLQLLLNDVPMLILLVWLVWLIHNDHRCNPKEVRRSLLRPFFAD